MKCFRYLYFVLTVIFFSCSRDVIGEKDMVVIISELYKADRYVNVNYQLLRKADTTRVYEAILNKYEYTTSDFVRSLDYYLERPGKLKSIYMRAKGLIEEEDELVEQMIEESRRMEVFMAPLREIVKDSSKVRNYSDVKRAWRWLLIPESHPVWSVVMNDSLRSLYENPGMVIWWTNNFGKDKTINYLTLEDEKDSSPIHISSKRGYTDKKRRFDDR